MSSITDVLDQPAIYRLWQAPFARQKLRPLVESGALERAGSVLDVGCGPGTNAATLSRIGRYLGVDISEEYIEYARRRHGDHFVVADVTEGIPGEEGFDLVLLNSLMHHIDDPGALRLLTSLRSLLLPGGEIHILDLVLADAGLPRRLALEDRGDFPRSVDQWVSLIDTHLDIRQVTPYPVGIGGFPLWQMVHVVCQ